MPKYFIIFLFCCLALFSCNENNDKKNNNQDYDLVCKIGRDIRCDSLTLWIYEGDYSHVRMLSGGKVKRGYCNLRGHIEEAKTAFIKLKGDTSTYFFILEPTNQKIIINKNSFKLEGGEKNNILYNYLVTRNNLEKQRTDNQKRYFKALKDTTLMRPLERKLFVKDSILTDSIERMTQRRLNSHDVIRPIIIQKFGVKPAKQSRK